MRKMTALMRDRIRGVDKLVEFNRMFTVVKTDIGYSIGKYTKNGDIKNLAKNYKTEDGCFAMVSHKNSLSAERQLSKIMPHAVALRVWRA